MSGKEKMERPEAALSQGANVCGLSDQRGMHLYDGTLTEPMQHHREDCPGCEINGLRAIVRAAHRRSIAEYGSEEETAASGALIDLLWGENFRLNDLPLPLVQRALDTEGVQPDPQKTLPRDSQESR